MVRTTSAHRAGSSLNGRCPQPGRSTCRAPGRTFLARLLWGRGLYSVLYEHLDDLEDRVVREGEFMSNILLGWNFGDGHLNDERLVAAVQARLGLEPGDLVMVYCESQATPWLHGRPQEYRVIDAALGTVERGTWDVRDCVATQPLLPDGPIPLQVTWTAPGFRRRHTLTGTSGTAGQEQPA